MCFHEALCEFICRLPGDFDITQQNIEFLSMLQFKMGRDPFNFIAPNSVIIKKGLDNQFHMRNSWFRAITGMNYKGW